MERAALVVADSGLTVVGSRGNVSTPSPGLALLDGDDLLVGDDALRNARLKPRRIHSRFWQLLDTHPLARPFPRHLRTADLVHAHLSDVWRRIGRQPNEVILVVPGVYSADQLALLLGVAASAEIPVRGMVDLAVAAAADRASRRRCLHLDLHLHRVVLTEIEHGSDVVRGRVWEHDGVGLSGLYDLWARTVARLFVRQTRFDPLHLAVSEQLLYLDLPRHIEALQDGETTRITIPSGGRQHTIDLNRNDVVEATQRATDTISAWVRKCTDLEDTTVLLGDHIASVPGLLDHLGETAEADITVLHPASAGSTALAHAERIVTTAEALPFVTRLPGYDARPPGPVTVPVTPPTGTGPATIIPTHMVVDGVATALTEAPISLEIGGAESRDGDEPGAPQQPVVVRRIGVTVVVEAPPGVTVVVNGHRTESSTALAAGDRLQIGEPPLEVLFVTMAP
jgi:hypothetical protein